MCPRRDLLQQPLTSVESPPNKGVVSLATESDEGDDDGIFLFEQEDRPVPIQFIREPLARHQPSFLSFPLSEA